MAVVPLDQVWVDANFKEPQLAGMRVGQPVTLTADLYGNSIRYHGKVVGFSAGTGSAFSLLPAQYASGNWIKIVQRVPVRIALDPREIAANPLQIGLTMKAEVNVRDEGGVRLPQLARNDVAYSTDVFHSTDEAADSRVREIIAANDPGVTSRPGLESRDNKRRLVEGKATDRPSSVKARPARATPVALHLTPDVALGGGGRFQ
jgi:membrane fusion protein (multidrug efflux system)